MCLQPEEAEYRKFQQGTYRDLENSVESLVSMLSPPEPERNDDHEASEVGQAFACWRSAY